MEGDQEEKGARHIKVHLDGILARFGRTLGSADPTWQALVLILLWQADMWALISFLVCLCVAHPFALPDGPSL